MQNHFQLSDGQLECSFQDCSLLPPLFSHEAHLRLAWIHIRRYGIQQACDNLCQQIKRFDETHGDGTKFNTTVTVAAAKVVYHFMQKKSGTNFQDFLSSHPRLSSQFKVLIHTHYGFDIFNHPEAINQYLEPDLLPFS